MTMRTMTLSPRHVFSHGTDAVLTIVLFLVTLGFAQAKGPSFAPDVANELVFSAHDARFVRLVILGSSRSQPCLDEFEIFTLNGEQNLALARNGAKATASSCLSGYPIHQIEHLNDGLYGNGHSWIAAGVENEWAQIELPSISKVAKVVFSRDREKRYRDRMPVSVEVRLSLDGKTWQTACRAKAPGYVTPVRLPEPATWDQLVQYAFLCERKTWSRISTRDHLSPLRVERPANPGGEPYWGHIARLDPLERVMVQIDQMLERLVDKGLDVERERSRLVELRHQHTQWETASQRDEDARESLYLEARLVKRKLMFRDPELMPLQRILFVKRHPYLASHNYSDILDSQFRPGGGICLLEIPWKEACLDPSDAKLVTLFDATDGIARDPVSDFEGRRIYFAYRPNTRRSAEEARYWHLMVIPTVGGQARQISDGPFHDYYPCPLPDGGLSFISTRCRSRFLCWRPQAFVLFRMDREGQNIRPLSFANLSEWSPASMRDGRILWTRSEYLDKGANFGHTLWAIRPDGTHPELIFGNNTINCYLNGREVPERREICCTLISHGGDHNGPIGLIDLTKGPFDSRAITNITPDVAPHYDMSWARRECFRDPMPLSRDYFLVSHAPADRWGLYVIDRYGNRELIYFDPAMGSMSPTPLRSTSRPPVLPPHEPAVVPSGMGQFMVNDVYRGLDGVERGKVKYLRVCQEVRSDLEQLPNGEFRNDHGPVFQDFYATPIHKVNGPFGWPSYVAKASLGIVPVESDGSANFLAPSGKVLYFQALDGALNEVQRMRSVIQLQPGEQRSCIGCHEHRQSSPTLQQTLASCRIPDKLKEPPWGAVPFSYEGVVQPVWDAKCVRCHDANDKQKMDLTGTLDPDRVPRSYRTLISGGWVHHFNWWYAQRHQKAAPMSFGTVKSRLWEVLDAAHYDVQLTRDEQHRVKCWIDLNCPLWPDYLYRPNRSGPNSHVSTTRR